MEIFYTFFLCFLPEKSHSDYNPISKVARLFHNKLYSKSLMLPFTFFFFLKGRNFSSIPVIVALRQEQRGSGS